MKKSLILVCLSQLTMRAAACDLCAVYSAMHAHGELDRGPYVGVAEQFTRFGTLQRDGHEVSNEADQFLQSSFTQAVVGYAITERFSLQVNVPFIYRTFRRPEETGIVRDTINGVGDVSLLAKLIVFRKDTSDFTFSAGLIGGVKFPTGSAQRLQEETEEGHHQGVEEPAHEEMEHHHESGTPEHEPAEAQETEPADEIESGVHGHDLALGSGSIDGVVGGNVFVRFQRVFFSGEVQYTIRQEGDYDYRYANDLTWRGGPGVYAILRDACSLSLQANVSGEYKRKDEVRGEIAEDTAITAVYLGPQVSFTWGSRLSLEAGADFPVSIDNSALQIVPDWRLRGGVTWRF